MWLFGHPGQPLGESTETETVGMFWELLVLKKMDFFGMFWGLLTIMMLYFLEVPQIQVTIQPYSAHSADDVPFFCDLFW
jgi:hypothetical protein